MLSTLLRASPRKASVPMVRRFLNSYGRDFSVKNMSTSSIPQPTNYQDAALQRLSITFGVPTDGPGALSSVLRLFQQFNINLSRIESRPSKKGDGYDFVVDLEPVDGVHLLPFLLDEMNKITRNPTLRPPTTVPWFPLSIKDIDQFSMKTLEAGAELESDHPGFKDPVYRERRRMIVETAQKYRHGDKIPRIDYTDVEIDTWRQIYTRQRELAAKYGIDCYNQIVNDMERECGYAPNNIPQLQDISDFLRARTGFTVRPVGGLLSSRDFLNALAFRVFFSTQYIRHHGAINYCPEPDICHETLGHCPMFADPDFADFSHEIGLASLGASDEEIKRLATCYWFSVEFGLCKENGAIKGYGAGIMSSFGEMEFACSPTRPAGGEDVFPEYRPWDPFNAAVQPYPITTYQPVYYVAESLSDAKMKMRAYCDTLSRPFHVKYDPVSETVIPDRAVVRGAYESSVSAY